MVEMFVNVLFVAFQVAKFNGYDISMVAVIATQISHLKSCLHICRQDRKYMFANTFLKLSTYALVFV